MTCVAIESEAILGAAEMCWCGASCSSEGLRHSNEGLYGRNGFLLEDTLTGSYFSSSTEITSFVNHCDRDSYGFIQSYNTNQGTLDSYSKFTFGFGLDNVLTCNSLKASEQALISEGGYSVVDLEVEDALHKFMGPKGLLYYGVVGDTQDGDLFNSTTVSGLTLDPTGVFVSDSTSISKGTELVSQFRLVPRTTTYRKTLGEIAVADPLYASTVMVEIDNTRAVFGRLMDNGAGVYTVFASVWTASGAALTTFQNTANHNLGDIAKPLVHPFGTGSMVFVPSRNKLYIGQPYYNGTQTGQGRIYVLNWNGSTFAVGTHITFATANAHLGSCIGYDATTDCLVSGWLDDQICTITSGGTRTTIHTGASGSKIGYHFAVGDSYMIFRDAVNERFTLAQFDASSLAVKQNVNGGTAQKSFYSGVYTPGGRGTTRVPVLFTRNGNACYWAFKGETGTSLIVGNSTEGNCRSAYSWARLSGYTDHRVGWEDGYVVQGEGNGDWSYSAIGYTAFSITDILLSMAQTVTFTNGTDEAYYICYCTANGFTRYAHLVKRETASITHAQIGSHYISDAIDVSTAEGISAASVTHGLLDALKGTSLWFFIRFDDETAYRTINTDGTTNSFSSISDAKINANMITDFSSRVPLLNILAIGMLRFYFCLKKDNSEYYPIETPKINEYSVTLHRPATVEPEICLHFSGTNSRISRVEKTFTGKLKVSPQVLGDLERFTFISTGRKCRELF